ncbi:uncharacterized protein [Nicotiana sylvestris]|uniref:Uncharacterized protein LOC104238949 isoform X1 n=1 Tax=Nicotiana sylvestris TaxID=4096 RepID=A0A1U7XLK0_NICSY|nr:PREDICTED: uncharacterized protein LOC104238949 isoform X1 [Nicotiana sylvestris]
MLTSWRLFPASFTRPKYCPSGFYCRAEDQVSSINERQKKKKKVLIVGSGWAGLGAAHHLCKQGFEVAVLEGGYEFGPKNQSLSPDDVGIRGFWYPYRNIFALVDEIGIKPFTDWTKSAQYSADGLEVQFPVLQNEPQLPAPLGSLLYSKFVRVPLVDQLTLLPLMAAIIDFDYTDSAWTKYDPVTARELLKQFGCSERLYRDILDPLIEVGLYAPAEQCSAAATLAVLYYYVVAHQKHFDLAWCRGRVREQIFEPWMVSLKTQGCKFLRGRKVTDMLVTGETNCISEVVCEKESFVADAVIFAVGVSTLQEIIQNSAALCSREEFLKVLNLASIDLLSVKLQLDRKVNIPNASNVSSGFDNSHAWTFFDLNMIYDEHKEDPVTVLQADFYHATDLLPLKDDRIVSKVMSCLSRCIKDFENATVVDKEIERFPKSLTHFFPGSYKYMMGGSTSFKNLFIAGDWIVNRHGSWSQEISYVAGLEAANRVVDYLGKGTSAKIIPVEEDEPHIQALRTLNRNVKEIRALFPWSDYFLQ